MKRTDFFEQFLLSEKLISVLPDGVGLMDLQGNLEYVSKQVLKIFGIDSLEDIESQNIFDYVHKTEKQYAKEALKNILKDEKRKEGLTEYKLVRPDGLEFYAEITTTLIKDDNGVPKKLLFLMRDTTEKRLKETEYEKMNTIFRSIIENSDDIITKFDYNLRHIYISPAIEKITGLECDFFIGRTNEELGMDPDVLEIWNKTLKKVFETGVSKKVEFSYIGLYGINYFESVISPEFNSDGEVIALIGINRNITDKTRLENMLKGSEERFRLYIQYSPHPIFTTNSKREIIDVNNAAIKITECQREELLSIKLIDLVVEESKESVLKGYEEIDKTGKTSYEVSIVSKMGTLRWMAIDEIKLDEDIIVGFCKDITDSKVYGRKMRYEKERAENANRAKSEFLSNISHELRTPLNGIIGFSEILEKMETNPEKKELSGLINRSGKNLMVLINEILDLSKIEAGRMELINEKFKIDELIRSIKEMFEGFAELKGIEFNIIKENEVENELIGDKLRLKQIFTNIVGNSLKFTEKGYVRFSIREIEQNEEKVKIEFTIEDTGPGISEKKQERLYEIFEQGEEFLTKKHGGTGLGLAIVKRLVDLMNGEITFKSILDKGTIFKIIIVLKKDLSGCEEEKENCKVSKKIKILYAEDNYENSLLMKYYLDNEIFEITNVSNGEEAVEEWIKNSYDIILMDLQMPVLNGIDAIKVIRGMEETKNMKRVPIIAVSAIVNAEEIDRAIKNGADECLTKPLNSVGLLKSIRKHVNL